MACQIVRRFLQGNEDLYEYFMVNYFLVNESIAQERLFRKISLTTCELDLRPRDVDPYLTASFA